MYNAYFITYVTMLYVTTVTPRYSFKSTRHSYFHSSYHHVPHCFSVPLPPLRYPGKIIRKRRRTSVNKANEQGSGRSASLLIESKARLAARKRTVLSPRGTRSDDIFTATSTASSCPPRSRNLLTSRIIIPFQVNGLYLAM